MYVEPENLHTRAFGSVGRYFWLSCPEERGVGEVRDVAKHSKATEQPLQHRVFLSKCQQRPDGEALPEGLNGGHGGHLGSEVLGIHLLPFPN